MAERWLDITDITAEGREFVVDDQELWTQGWREFGMDVAPARNLEAAFLVVPKARGVLVRGKLTGAVMLACDRCTAPVQTVVEQSFDLFEEEPLDGSENLEPSLVRRRGHKLELDVGGMLWEEFVLALPVKPLCSEKCKGLCPGCGQDLNSGTCACGVARTGSSFAALHGLVIDKKDKQ